MNSGDRTARRVALIAAIAVGALLAVGAFIGATATIAGILSDTWTGRVDLLTGRAPVLAVDGVVPEAGGGSAVYGGAIITADAELLPARAMQAIAAALGALVIVSGGLLLVLLAVRMLRSRPFARLLSWGLGIVGFVVIAAASVSPQLEALAVDVAVRELGYAAYDDTHDGTFDVGDADAIAPHLWDPLWILDRVDPAMLLLGIVLGVLGLLVAEGLRMQRETEGLI